jgi:hypothetical protein
MEIYKNLNGNSSVTHYNIGQDYIEVKFQKEPAIYAYNNLLNGIHHIEMMKSYAIAGRGLGSYINKNPSVRDRFMKQIENF